MNRELETLYAELGERVMGCMLAERFIPQAAVTWRAARENRPVINPFVHKANTGMLELEGIKPKELVGRCVLFHNGDGAYEITRVSKKGNLVGTKKWEPHKGASIVMRPDMVSTVLTIMGGSK